MRKEVKTKMFIQLNKKQSQVLATLFFNNRAGRKYMTSRSIKEQCQFEKSAIVAGCLTRLIHEGFIDTETQELLDGSVCNFYYIPDEVMERLNTIVSFEIQRK